MDDTQQPSNTFPPEGLTLKNHMDLIGITPKLLSIHSKVPEQIIQRALEGGSIIEAHAQAICRVLNDRHKFMNQVGIEPSHIRGLDVWKPHPQHEKTTLNLDK